MNVLLTPDRLLERDPTLDPYELRRVLKWNESGCVTCYSECGCSKPLQLDKSEQKLYDKIRGML